MWRKIFVLILAVLSVGSMFIQPAAGKEYPTKPIEIVVTFGAGTSVDIICRLIADIAPKYIGQPVVVVNKPGAGGSTGVADLVSSKPDGYKVVTCTNFYFAATLKTQKVPFDENDLIPIRNFFEYRNGLGVKGDSPWRTLGDMLDFAKKNPGKLRWAHFGRGLTPHIDGVLIFRKSGIDAIDIPYKSAAEILAAILGGHVDAGVIACGANMDNLKAGKIKYLVLFTERRYSDLPDVPCAVELGFPEIGAMNILFGLYAHKDTPEDVRKTLVDVFGKILEDPELKAKVEKLGEIPRSDGPEFMKESIKRGEEIAVPILKETGLYIRK